MVPNAPVIIGKANIMARVQTNFTTNVNTMTIRMDDPQADGSWKITRDCFNYDAAPVQIAE